MKTIIEKTNLEKVTNLLENKDITIFINHFKLKNVADFKNNKKVFCETYNITQTKYKDVKKRVQDYFLDTLKKDFASIKTNVFSYQNVLQSMFSVLEKDAKYKNYINILKLEKISVTEFVAKFYTYVDKDKNLLCIKKDIYLQNKCNGKNLDEYLIVAKFAKIEKFTDTLALSVLKQSLNNFKYFYQNFGIKNLKKYSNEKFNIFEENSLYKVYELDYKDSKLSIKSSKKLDYKHTHTLVKDSNFNQENRNTIIKQITNNK